MSIDELQLRAKKLHNRGRRDLIMRWSFAAVASVFCAYVMWSGRSLATRVIAGLVLAILLIQTIRSLYWFVRVTEPDAARSSFVDFYRKELMRQQQLAQQPVWQTIPVLFVIGWLMRSSVVRVNSLRPVLIVTLIAAAGLTIMLIAKRLEARRIQKEIDVLDQIEVNDRS